MTPEYIAREPQPDDRGRTPPAGSIDDGDMVIGHRADGWPVTDRLVAEEGHHYAQDQGLVDEGMCELGASPLDDGRWRWEVMARSRGQPRHVRGLMRFSRDASGAIMAYAIESVEVATAESQS
jgi:hypothetical protein